MSRRTLLPLASLAKLASANRGGGRGVPWGLIYMLCSAFLFSIMSLLVKQLGEIGSFALVFWRSVFMVLGTTSILLVRRENPLGEPGTRGLLMGRGVANFAFMSAFYCAVKSLHLSDAVVITYTSPVITGVAATLVYGEPWGRLDAFGSLLSMTGVVLVSKPSFILSLVGVSEPPLPWHGTAAAIVASLSNSMFALSLRLRREISPLVSANYIAIVSAVLGLVIGHAGGEDFAISDSFIVAKFAVIGALSSASQILTVASLGLETAGKATAMNYLQVVFAYTWQALIFHHPGDSLSFAGSILITCWGAISLFKEGSGTDDIEFADDSEAFLEGSWHALEYKEMNDFQELR